MPPRSPLAAAMPILPICGPHDAVTPVGHAQHAHQPTPGNPHHDLPRPCAGYGHLLFFPSSRRQGKKGIVRSKNLGVKLQRGRFFASVG